VSASLKSNPENPRNLLRKTAGFYGEKLPAAVSPRPHRYRQEILAVQELKHP
jgi:hypothetical protein